MNKQTKEALEMAIEDLTEILGELAHASLTIKACKKALAEAEKQEPVAWIVKEHLDNPISALVRTQRPTKECNTPLYLRKEL